jgi:succinate-semialdehyde dehydrogenase/glutarate-semialdehyde dehydrogenase
VVGEEKLALQVAAQIHAGSVNINEGFRASFSSMESPMGGFKASGFGRRNGVYGLLRFTETKTIGVAKTWFRLPSRGAEYARLAPILRLMLRFLK